MAKFQMNRNQKDALAKAERILMDLVPTINGAQNCGMDCEIAKQHHEYLRQQIENIRKEFGGNPGT